MYLVEVEGCQGKGGARPAPARREESVWKGETDSVGQNAQGNDEINGDNDDHQNHIGDVCHS